MNNAYLFKKLHELCIRITDGSHYSPSGVEKGIPMLSVKDMLENGFSYDRCKFISYNDYAGLVKADCKPLKNDVLIAKDGSFLKHVFVIKEEIDQAVLSSIGILRPNTNLIFPDYLKYYLQTASVKQTVSKKYVSGSALPRIILKNFGEIDVLFRHIAEQQKIASILSALDSKIEINNRINAELEAMAKALYDYWFVQFDFPDENGRPYKSSGGKMVWNEVLKREIPMGWEVKELRCYLASSRGVSYNGKDIIGEGIPMINLNSFNTNSTYKSEGIKFFSGDYNKSKLLKPFDLVMCNTQQTALDPQKDIIGKSFLVPDIFDSEIVSSHHVTTINIKDDNMKYYLNSLFSTVHFHRYISGYATGTNILSLNFEGVLSYRTVIPHDELLSKYKSIIANIEKRKSGTIKQNHHLASLRDWLLPMLMNGQVRVE